MVSLHTVAPTPLRLLFIVGAGVHLLTHGLKHSVVSKQSLPSNPPETK